MTTPGNEEPLWKQAVNPLSKERLSRLSLGTRHRVTPFPEQLKQKLESSLGGSNPSDSDSRNPLPSASPGTNPCSGVSPSQQPEQINPCHGEADTPAEGSTRAQLPSARTRAPEPPHVPGYSTGYERRVGERPRGTSAEACRASGISGDQCQSQDKPCPSSKPSLNGGGGPSPSSDPSQRPSHKPDELPRIPLATDFQIASKPWQAEGMPGSGVLLHEGLGEAFKARKGNPESGDITSLRSPPSELAQQQHGPSSAGPIGLGHSDRGCEADARLGLAHKASGTVPLQQFSRPTLLPRHGDAAGSGHVDRISKPSWTFPAADGWKPRRNTAVLPQPSRDRLAAFDLLDDVPDLGPPERGPASGSASLDQLDPSLSKGKSPATVPMSSSLPTAGSTRLVSRHFAQPGAGPAMLIRGTSTRDLPQREAGGERDRLADGRCKSGDGCREQSESSRGACTSSRGSQERRNLSTRCAKGQFVPPRPAGIRPISGTQLLGRPGEDVDPTPALARTTSFATGSLGAEGGPRGGPEGMEHSSGLSLAPPRPPARREMLACLGKGGIASGSSRASSLRPREQGARKTAEDCPVGVIDAFMRSGAVPAPTWKHGGELWGSVPTTSALSRDAPVKGVKKWAVSTAGKPKRRLQRVYEEDNDGGCNALSQDLDDADLLRDLSNIIQTRRPSPRSPYKLEPARRDPQSARDQSDMGPSETECALEFDAVSGAQRREERTTQGGAVRSPPTRDPVRKLAPAGDAADLAPVEPCDSDDSDPRFGLRAPRKPLASLSPTIPKYESEVEMSPQESPRNAAGGAVESGWKPQEGPHEAARDRTPLRRLCRASDREPATLGARSLKSNPFATSGDSAHAGAPSLKHVQVSRGSRHPSRDSILAAAMGLLLHPVRPRVANDNVPLPLAIVLDDDAEGPSWCSPGSMEESPVQRSVEPAARSAGRHNGVVSTQLFNPKLSHPRGSCRPETLASSFVNRDAELKGRVTGSIERGVPATTAQRGDLMSRKERDACMRSHVGAVTAPCGLPAPGGDEVVDLSGSPQQTDGLLEEEAAGQQQDGGQEQQPPWWHLLPDFVPVTALQNGFNPRDGSRIFIDYARQFSGAPALRSTGPRSPRGRDAPGQKKSPSKKRKSQGTAGQSATGRWLTQDGRKVYVTAKGVRKTGQDAYRTAMRQSK